MEWFVSVKFSFDRRIPVGLVLMLSSCLLAGCGGVIHLVYRHFRPVIHRQAPHLSLYPVLFC